MPHQNALNVGDIIRVGKSTVDRLVVRAEHKIDYDRTRGDSYSVDEIDTVELANAEYNDPKIASFYFDHGSMAGTGKKISTNDVKVTGKCKVKPIVTTKYEVSNIKSY